MSAPTTVIAIPASLVITLLKWCRAGVWGLCVGGLWMGFLVAHATTLRSAKFTLLGGIAGWPEVWGFALMTLGAISVLGRLISTRPFLGRRTGFNGNTLAAVAMFGMSIWYAVFASSLILGTAEYGYAPYLTLAALHAIFGVLVHRTDGFRFAPSR